MSFRRPVGRTSSGWDRIPCKLRIRTVGGYCCKLCRKPRSTGPVDRGELREAKQRRRRHREPSEAFFPLARKPNYEKSWRPFFGVFGTLCY
jgi:hypothetical protein